MRVTSENYSDKMAETRFRSWETSSLLVAALIFVVSIHLCLSSCGAAVSAQETTSSCHISSVKEAEPTNITCTFSPDVYAARNNIKILRFVDEDRKGAAVALCIWIKDGLDCDTTSGYEFNNHILTDEVVIRVPHVSRDQSGRYVCLVLGSASTAFASCNFIVMTAGLTTCAIPSVKMSSQTSLTCYFPEDVSKTRADISVYHHSIQGRTDTVMSCVWKKEKLNCSTLRGYEVNGNVTDHVILRVHNTSETHEGTYNCQITGFASAPYDNCSFQLEKEDKQQLGTTSSCNIPSVQETEAAELVCTFSVDVNVTKQNFKVIHLGHEGRKNVGILICIWVGDGVDCTTSPTYEFNNTVTSQLVLRIPRASRDHNGTYACYVLGSLLDGSESCEFMVLTEPLVSSMVAAFFIFSLYRLSSAQDNSTICDVLWVEPLANTSVTCHLPLNVNQTSSIFGVSFESDDREKKIQADILDCGWFSGKRKCSISRPGYKYNDMIHVSNTFSLEIPRASAEHIGTYTCHLENINPENFKPCEFRVKIVGKTMCAISSVESNTNMSLTCYYPRDLNKTRTNFAVYHYSSGLTEVIMACEWKGDNLTCNTTHGYEFDDRVSDYLTLKIPVTLESQERAYSCHISGTGFLYYDNCTVTPEKSDVTSTCHISSVEEAEPTALTCKFSVDVNMTKRNFTVVHLSDADRKDADIASCTWLRDHLTCTTAFGYEFNNTVRDHVIISVPQASHNHSGTYACQVMGTVSSGFEPCEFIIMPVSDKSSLNGLMAAGIIVMCIPLSLIIVIVILRKNTSLINKRPCKEVEANKSDERTSMIPDEDGGRDQKACKNVIEYFEKVEKPPTRIVIVGKTGNGKSTLANQILGRHDNNRFPAGVGMRSVTLETTSILKEADNIEVVDTLDPFNCEADTKHEVTRWKNWNESPKSAEFPRCLVGVVVAIRCDSRYLTDEYAIYQNIKELWGPDFCDRLVVAFTFGDRLHQEPGEFENNLKTMCQELKDVLKDADNNYVVFNCHAEPTKIDINVQDLLRRIWRIPHQKGN